VAIKIDGVFLAEFQRINRGCITIILPATSPGSHALQLVGHGQTVANSTFATVDVDNQTPIITSIDPQVDYYNERSLPVNAYRARAITYKGQNLSSVTGVWMDGVALSYQLVDANTIVA
jgi:hypothetical protein